MNKAKDDIIYSISPVLKALFNKRNIGVLNLSLKMPKASNNFFEIINNEMLSRNLLEHLSV